MCRLSRNRGASASWNPQGLSRPVMGLLYPTLHCYTNRKWVRVVAFAVLQDGVICWRNTAPPFVPRNLLVVYRRWCRRFAACKRSLNLSGIRNLGKITGHLSRPHFNLSLLGSLASLRTYRHLASKVGTSKVGGKQWQTSPKDLPRMQCARAAPVTWLGSGSCQPELQGWILMNEWMNITFTISAEAFVGGGTLIILITWPTEASVYKVCKLQ